MSGNDYTRCAICGAVALDEPLPCTCANDSRDQRAWEVANEFFAAKHGQVDSDTLAVIESAYIMGFNHGYNNNKEAI